jgi:hypothetical protein
MLDLRFHEKPEWFSMSLGSQAEREAKAALGRQTRTSLNIYTGGLTRGLLGWATFPWDLEASPDLDGVVLLHSSLPGNPEGPFNLGMTGVHEVGHWLGLFHTFQGGCTAPGDDVDDTPFEAEPGYQCPRGRDSCPNQAGVDAIENYMNYSDDACMTGFSGGQVRRMRDMAGVYRTALLEASVADARAKVSLGALREVRRAAE